MKKSLLATAGVVGACAACCAIPVAIPLLGGLSVAGLTGMATSHAVTAATAGLAIAGVVGGSIWWRRRRQVAAACLPVTDSSVINASDCGCSPAA